MKVSSTLSLPSALDGGGWSMPRPGRFTPGKTRYPLYMVGPQGRSGRVRKISPPLRFDPRTVQPVASHSLQLRLEAANVTMAFMVATFTLVTIVTSDLTITMVSGTRRKFFAQQTCSDL